MFFQDTFPVRDELLSDLSDDDMNLAKVPEPLKPTVISFKHKDDTDLFGLGIQEEAPAAKDSSEEQEGKSWNIRLSNSVTQWTFWLEFIQMSCCCCSDV